MARLLIDTQVLVWARTGSPRLKPSARDALLDADAELYVSAVTAFELSDLQARGRIKVEEDIATLATKLGFDVLDFPAEAWKLTTELPDIHRDPVDRMLIAHAIILDMTLVTADKDMRSYPVKSLW